MFTDIDENLFDDTHPIIIPLKGNGVTSFSEVRKPTQEVYKEEKVLKIKLMVEAPPWDLSSPEYSPQEQSMFNYRGWFVRPNTQARGQIFINSVASYDYDTADVMNDNFATLLESFVSTSLLQVVHLIPRRYQGLTVWFLPRSGAYCLRNHSI